MLIGSHRRTNRRSHQGLKRNVTKKDRAAKWVRDRNYGSRNRFAKRERRKRTELKGKKQNGRSEVGSLERWVHNIYFTVNTIRVISVVRLLVCLEGLEGTVGHFLDERPSVIPVCPVSAEFRAEKRMR